MRKRIAITTILTIVVAYFGIPAASAPGPSNDLLEYEVISVQPGSWLVTAKEVASGEIVKFRLPPTAFKGKTFDADLTRTKKGHKFSVRGPQSDRLNNLIVEKGLPTHRGKNQRSRHLIKKRPIGPPAQVLNWEIVHVDPQQFIVTARNNKNQRLAKFKVEPHSFKGFRFKANLRGIRQGRGFTMQTSNNSHFSNACTLLELKQ
jgi:hypothetical protein